MVLCFDPASDRILAAEIVPVEADVEAALAVLHGAMTRPSWGRARRPTSLRTNEQEIARAVRSRFGIAAREAPIPEAAALLASFAEHIDRMGEPAHRGYLDAGASAEELSRLFAVASRLWQARPWERLGEHELLRVSVPALGIHDVWVSVLGGAGETFGLGFFRSLASYYALRSAGPAPERARTDLKEPVSSLLLEDAQNVPVALLAEQRQHGWALGAERMFPLVIAADADLVHRPLCRDDIVRAAALTEAVLAFWDKRRDAWCAGEDPIDEIPLASWPGEPVAQLAAQNTEPTLADAPPAEGDHKALFPHVIHGLFELVRGDRRLAGELESACDYFFGCHWRRDLEDDEHIARLSYGQLMEWFCLERSSRAYGEPPIETYLRNPRLPPAHRALAELIKGSAFGFFAIVAIEPEQFLTVRDLWSDEELRVRERLATRSVQPGGLLIGRIFPLGDGTWTLSGAAEYRSGADLEAGRARLREIDTPRLSQLAYGRDRGRDLQARPGEWERPDLERRLRLALRAGRISITLAALKKRVRTAASPAQILEALTRESFRKDEEWAYEMAQLLMALWNLTPRPELGNRAPSHVAPAGAGPEELRLMREFMAHVESTAVFRDPSASEETIRRSMNAELATWMQTPQESLGGLTPRQVIEQERKTLAARREDQT